MTLVRTLRRRFQSNSDERFEKDSGSHLCAGRLHIRKSSLSIKASNGAHDVHDVVFTKIEPHCENLHENHKISAKPAPNQWCTVP